ncbi:MAG: ABC transporter substrate-binding protein [Candidatus Thorarchaeota archaeon]
MKLDCKDKKKKYFLGLFVCCALLLPIFVNSTNAIPIFAEETTMDFVMAYPSDIGEQNPVFARSARSTWYDMLIYDTLISYDDNLDIIPWLAESWDMSTDGMTLTFTIREGVTWHDGAALTPEDIKFTFGLHKNATADANNWALLQHTTSITVVGQDVVVVFDEPFSFALDFLGSMHILPKHIREGIAADASKWDDQNDAEAHIGSGPFKFISRVADEYIDMERNDVWWGPNNPYIGQLPNIEELRIDIVLGQDARILAMKAGDADTERYEVFGAYVNSVLDAPELQLVTGVVSQWDYVLGFNMNEAPFDDPDVRDAVALVLDRQQLVDIGRLGYGTPTNSCIPAEFYPNYYDSDGAFPAKDNDTANDILDDGGYTAYTGDFRDGLEFDLWVLSWDDVSVATGTGIKLQLAEIGIDCTVVVTDDGPMYDGIYSEPRAFIAYEMSHGFSQAPDHVWWRMHSDNIVDWGDNCYGLDDATVDSHLDDFMGATPAELTAAARQVQIDCLEHKPYIPLFMSDDTHAMRSEWVNFTTPPGGPFTSFNPRTMVFMYDSDVYTEPTTTTGIPTPGDTTPDTTSDSTTTESTVPTFQLLESLPLLVTIASLGVIVVFVALICRSRN